MSEKKVSKVSKDSKAKAYLKGKITKEKSLNGLLTFLFALFLVFTVVYIFYTIVVPTPTEWGIATGELQRSSTGNYVAIPNATSFPNNLGWENFWKAEERHLALFPDHITGSFLIDTINFAFLTMFIRNIGRDIHDAMLDDEKNRKVQMSDYVGWSMGALISGILFFSSSIAAKSISDAILYMAVIVVFALVSYFILYRLREKMIDEEEKSLEKARVKRKED
jgi:dolichol kinase